MGRKSNAQKELEARLAAGEIVPAEEAAAAEPEAPVNGHKRMTNGVIVADVHPLEVENYRKGGYYEV